MKYNKERVRKVGRVKEICSKFRLWFSKKFIFFGKNSGIHGLKQVFDEKNIFISRLFWVVILLISSGCLYIMLAPVAELGDEINFTPDTRYLNWETIFPAVTVCESYNSKLAQRKFMDLYHLMEPMNFDYRKYLTELVYGRGSCGRAVCTPCGTTIACDINWRQIIEKVRKTCTEMIADCYFNDQEFPCCKKFQQVDSETGYCFAFNTLQSENSRLDELYTLNRTTGPGTLTFRLLFDAHISVHSPEELATNVLDIKLKFDVKTNTNNRFSYLFSMVEVENDAMLLAEEQEVRGCRKLEEIPGGAIHTYPVYSYGACRLAEDTEHMLDHCGCVHPVRHASYKNHYCNYTGVNCIRVTEVERQKLGNDKHDDHGLDHCLPSCVESELKTIHISRQWVREEPKPGTLVTIQMASLPNLRYIRNIVRTDLDIVVSIAGMVSLFFAASILSIVEIFYLFFRP